MEDFDWRIIQASPTPVGHYMPAVQGEPPFLRFLGILFFGDFMIFWGFFHFWHSSSVKHFGGSSFFSRPLPNVL
jgi:hypothetical protein